MNTLQDVLDAMGSMASDAEAEAMRAILKERGLEESEIPSIPQRIWFNNLIPAAIKRARGPVRKAELAAKRAAERAKFNDWAQRVAVAATAHDPSADSDDLVDKETLKQFQLDAFACEVAAELMRQAKPAQIKRAVTAVRKREKQREKR